MTLPHPWRRRSQDGKTKLYYASDVHGSDQCWRKFLAAAAFYGASASIMGGDLAGKAIVPIVKLSDGGFRAQIASENRTAHDEQGARELVAAARYNGFYPIVLSVEEVAGYQSDATARDELMERVILEDVRRWIGLADARVEEDGIPIYLIAGNDDPWSVDQPIGSAAHVVDAERDVSLVEGHEMISCSFANPTPWNSPRELPEDELYSRLARVATQLERPQDAIFNLHVPPYDSGLDTASLLDDDLRPILRGGAPVDAPVGSHAVREVIEEFQPLIALHGHIHESRAAARIGRTLCLNSGSEYNTGRLHGVVVTLDDDRATRHQFVAG